MAMRNAEMAVQLWEHQRIGVEQARHLDHYALFYEPGLGKTFTTITIIREKMNTHKRFFRTLIVAPIIVLENWKEEWVKYSKVDPAKIVVLIGSGKDRIRLLRKAREKFKDEFI